MRATWAALLLSLAAQAADQTLHLRIDGWHSKGDAYKTEQAVRGVKGVRDVSADLAKKELTVTFDDSLASSAAIEKAVGEAGYAAK
jgi:copper chaperone CopZ